MTPEVERSGVLLVAEDYGEFNFPRPVVRIHDGDFDLATARQIDRRGERLVGFHHQRMPIRRTDVDRGWKTVCAMCLTARLCRRRLEVCVVSLKWNDERLVYPGNRNYSGTRKWKNNDGFPGYFGPQENALIGRIFDAGAS